MSIWSTLAQKVLNIVAIVRLSPNKGKNIDTGNQAEDQLKLVLHKILCFGEIKNVGVGYEGRV